MANYLLPDLFFHEPRTDARYSTNNFGTQTHSHQHLQNNQVFLDTYDIYGNHAVQSSHCTFGPNDGINPDFTGIENQGGWNVSDQNWSRTRAPNYLPVDDLSVPGLEPYSGVAPRRSITYGSAFDATSFGEPDPWGWGNANGLTSDYAEIKPDNVGDIGPHQGHSPTIYAPSHTSALNPQLLQPSSLSSSSYISTTYCPASTTAHSNALDPLTMFDGSYVYNSPQLAPVMSQSKSLEPLGNSSHSNKSTARRPSSKAAARRPKAAARRRPAWSGVSKATRLAPKVDKLSTLELSETSVLGRLGQKKRIGSSVDHSDTCAPSHPAKTMVNQKDLEVSDKSVPLPVVPDIVDLKSHENSNTYIEDEVERDDIFARFTTLNDDVPDESTDVGMSDFHFLDAPNFNDSQVPDVLHPHTGHLCTSQPLTEAGSNEEPQPSNKGRSARKNASSRKARVDPKYRFFCANSTCYAGIESGFPGFAKMEDLQRHVLEHMEPRYICWLPHPSGCRDRFTRKDYVLV